ncbi:MAG: thiamine phosphate synthase [Daejeonella sp.]
MKKYISKFHYLTQDLPHRSHAEQTQLACEAGANWIQYRCLSKNDEDLMAEIHQLAPICDDWGATLILTGHTHLLDQVDAQGVHIEDIGADLAAIRRQIGDDKTLGASAHTFEDIQRIAQSGAADYIGCGPFRTTLTKPNDHALLGIEGYETIISKMKEAGISVPLLAVGGIEPDDAEDLLRTGVFGLAVSAAINLADDPREVIRNLYRKIY